MNNRLVDDVVQALAAAKRTPGWNKRNLGYLTRCLDGDARAHARIMGFVAMSLKRQGAKGAPRCGADTRAGHPCRRKPEPGKIRCRNHGGCSTGPKTPEGKARSAQNGRGRSIRR